MNDRHDLEHAVAARARGRSRVRAATTVAGVAGLVTAGVVAYSLPGSAHQQAKKAGSASTGGPATPSSSPASSRAWGDDSGEGSAGARTAAPASSGSSGKSHATSGGS